MVGCFADGLYYFCWKDVGDHVGEVGIGMRLYKNSRTETRSKLSCIRVLHGHFKHFSGRYAMAVGCKTQTMSVSSKSATGIDHLSANARAMKSAVIVSELEAQIEECV